MFTRRRFIQNLAGGLMLAGTAPAARFAQASTSPATPSHAFKTRGLVLVPQDLTLADWPERAKRAGLTTIGIHSSSPHFVIGWITTDAGQRFLESCRKLGLEVEFELHAMKELLPRSLFDKNPDFFRV